MVKGGGRGVVISDGVTFLMRITRRMIFLPEIRT
jgi:hypothetical protein